jgi:RNA polymerase sigma factor (sigma-70 family)
VPIYWVKMTTSDLDLLRQYAAQESEEAFAALVSRHLDLVYSAALRQVRSPQLAEEVAQSVFTDLSRKAQKLKPDTILTAWLYQVTRRTAVDVVRRESRRQLRERISTEMTAMNSDAPDWTQMEPLLDEAMEALEETERSAVLLRYFENRSLREVGQKLGTSEDAAQKRVSRAVERLRDYFARRGVAVGTAGIVASMSANAVQAAPAALAATVSGASLAGAAATASSLPTFLQVMTTSKSTIVALSTLVLAGVITPIMLQQRTIQRLRTASAHAVEELAALREARPAQNASMSQTEIDAAELERLRGEHAELLRLRGEVARLRQQRTEVGGRPPAGPAAASTAPGQDSPSPFASLPESDIPGRYRLTEGGAETQLLTLQPDGSFVTLKGERRTWALGRDALLIIWQTGPMRFTNITSPGVYAGTKDNNQIVRLEKVE